MTSVNEQDQLIVSLIAQGVDVKRLAFLRHLYRDRREALAKGLDTANVGPHS